MLLGYTPTLFWLAHYSKNIQQCWTVSSNYPFSNAGNDVYLKDIWPSNKEIEDTLSDSLNAEMFIKRYSNVSLGPEQWQKIKTEQSSIYNWEETSTYVKKPPFFDNLSDEPEGFKEIKDAVT